MKYIKVYIGLILVSIGVFILISPGSDSENEIVIESDSYQDRVEEFENPNTQIHSSDIFVESKKEIDELYVHTLWYVGEEVYNIKSLPDQTVYDAMVLAQGQNIFSFEGKQYPMLGFFVTRIGSLEMSRGKNLMYYINNIEAPTGVSNQILKEGDVIEWRIN